MNKCYIVGALGNNSAICADETDLVIAADRGCEKLGSLRADIIVGDFDSLGYVPAGDNVIVHPVRKDDTDTMLAVKTGFERGYTDFVILGGLGGALDHTLANVQTLGYILSRGGRGILVGENRNAVMIRDGAVGFDGARQGRVSVFAHGGAAEGVSVRGLEYEANGITLECDFPLGVSNSFKEGKATVEVKKGTLLIIFEGDARNCHLFD